MSTLTIAHSRTRKTPPDVPQPLRPTPHWEYVLGGEIAGVIESLRQAGFTLRVTGGFLDATAPVSANLALRAIRRRSHEIAAYLAEHPELAEPLAA
jgi:hypothetical protein